MKEFSGNHERSAEAQHQEHLLGQIEEAHRRALLEELPKELQKRWADEPLERIQNIVSIRERLGYKKVYGIHISPNETLPGDEYIKIGSDGYAHYTVDPGTLYQDKSGKWMYIIEGTGDDEWTSQINGWKKSHSKLRILEKVPMNREDKKMDLLQKYGFISPLEEIDN